MEEGEELGVVDEAVAVVDAAVARRVVAASADELAVRRQPKEAAVNGVV